MVDVENIIESKRSRKPKVAFVPEDTRTPKRRRGAEVDCIVGRPGRHRNKAMDSGATNRWDNYRQLMKKAVTSLLKEEHYEDLYSQARARTRNDSDDPELRRVRRKILVWKHTIVATLQAIAAENADYTRWKELAEADDDDMVEVAHILCSRCMTEETEDNDIMFCDRAGCLRAYHQKCLDPPVDLCDLNPDNDWCCWQCECLDDCLDLLSERLGEKDNKLFEDVEQVFPEIPRHSSLPQLLQLFGETQNLSLADREAQLRAAILGPALTAEEENDDDYEPTAVELARDALEEEERSQGDAESGSEGDGSDGDDGEDETGSVGEDVGVDDDEEEEERPESADGDDNGGDDDDDNNDNDGDDDDNEEDSEMVSDLDSDLEEDEVGHLLSEAGATHAPSYTSARSLRPRRTASNTPAHPEIVLACSAEDVGKQIAKVVRGVFVLGEVVSYSEEEKEETQQDCESGPSETVNESGVRRQSSWTLRFTDEEERVETDPATVRQACVLHAEYLSRSQNAPGGSAGQDEDDGEEVSAENILNERRRTGKPVDYVTLSLALFGSLYDEEDIRVADASETATREGRGSGGENASSDVDDDDIAEEVVDEEEYLPRGDKRKRKKGSKDTGTRARKPRAKASGAVGRKKRRVAVSDNSDDGDEADAGESDENVEKRRSKRSRRQSRKVPVVEPASDEEMETVDDQTSVVEGN